MALEDKIADLTAKIDALTTITQTLIEIRTDAVETVRTAAAPKASAAKKTEAAEAKVEAPKEEPKQEAAAPEGNYDGIPELIAGYVGGSTREEERAARKDKIKKLLRHDAICKPEMKAEAEKFDATDIRPDAIDTFREQIRLMTEAGDLTQPASAGGLVL